MEKAKYSVCLITVDSFKLANEIANGLVKEKLAACVNIIKGIKSIYRWQGRIEDSNELMLIIKTKRRLAKDVIRYVKEKHTYSVPEIIFLPIIVGNEDYLNWIEANTILTIHKNMRGKK
ncbi:MAG: divalent-cation tolerance protein CutA [Elusimicrobiales bacterium]